MDIHRGRGEFERLAAFVNEECQKRLQAYEVQPRDVYEHYATEIEVLSGGYAYRQLFELIQNAADAIIEAKEPEGKIHVRLTRNRLEAANTGAALDEEGITALLNARSSRKRGNQIGRFGIGFKSLLKLGGRVDLISRSIGLRFDPEACRNRIRQHLGLSRDEKAPGMRLAEVMDPSSENSPLLPTSRWHWATTVVSAEIRNRDIYARLSEELEKFPAEFLLFLPVEITLTLEIEGALRRQLTKQRQGDIITISDGDRKTQWRLFEETIQIRDRTALDDATHIHSRDKIPLSWAVPVGGREQAGRFWAFFPTETHSRTAGILNAPWKLNSDRTNLIRGPWNEAIMRAAADLISRSLTTLATSEDRGAAIDAFPRRLDRQDEIAAPLVRALWDRILEVAVLPNVKGEMRRADQLWQHFIEDKEICHTWAHLANEEARSRYLHPDCYATEARKSRLHALVEEAKRRDDETLRRPSSIEEWLDCLGSTNLAHAKKVLLFIDNLMKKRHKFGIWDTPEACLIPTADGSLATPSEVVIVSEDTPPAGFRAVAREVAADETCRKILVERLEVKELQQDSWDELLERSFERAQDSEEPKYWEDFWNNLAAAPKHAREEFLDYVELEDLRFRALSGKWQERNLLVVAKHSAGDAEDHVMDPVFARQIAPLVPREWLKEFPEGEEPLWDDPEALNPYLRRLSPEFEALCRAQTGRTPRYLPSFSSNTRMPAGWRLLAILPDSCAARLTEHLLRRSAEFSQVHIVHPTRAYDYPEMSVPHPYYFWLTEHGRIRIGGCTLPLKHIRPELAEILGNAGVEIFRLLRSFFNARKTATGAELHFLWEADEWRIHYSDIWRLKIARFWKAIFAILQEWQDDFRALYPVWERAAEDDAIPEMLPTADGPQPLSEIFVTTDTDLASGIDNGRLIVLNQAAASAWVKAGARPLEAPTLSYEERLSDPAELTEIFPELEPLKDRMGLETTHAIWVKKLEKMAKPFRQPIMVGRDTDGTLLLDRQCFREHGWKKGLEALVRYLLRNGLLKGIADPDPDTDADTDTDTDIETILSGTLDRRTDNAREAVRTERTLERKLLKAVGDDPRPLLDILPSATRQALGEETDPIKVARLALAVHGPTVLGKLRNALEEQGLEPPKRWGGEEARLFVRELGFPIEFAASASTRREAELFVSGPAPLPPLHDYQEEILNSLEALLQSGKGRRRAVVSLPTGAGKTRVAAEAVVRLVLKDGERRTALWVAQTDELCEQAVQCFRQLWINVGKQGEDLRIVRFWGGQKNPSPPEGDAPTVVVASIQTLNTRLNNPANHSELGWLVETGIIVIDECHHAIAPSYTDLLRWLGLQVGHTRVREHEPPMLGLSATPWRGYNEDESKRLAARFDRRWFPANQAELHDKLMKKGVLARRHYRPLSYGKPFTLTERELHYIENYGELPDSVAQRMGEDMDRNALIIDAIAKSKAQSILLFANSVEHAQFLAARLHLAGYSAAAVSGETDKLARQHFIRQFQNGQLRIICNHSVLATGFDAPKVDMILISRPVLSPVRYMQMVGRGLRGPRNGGTEYCEIVTVEDNIVNYRGNLAYHYCRRFFE